LNLGCIALGVPNPFPHIASQFFKTAVTMAMLCICGVCIPYSALLPLIAFLLKFMGEPFFKLVRLIEKLLPWAGPKTGSNTTKGDAHSTSSQHINSSTLSANAYCRQDIVEENINLGRKSEVVTSIKSMEQWEDHHAKYDTVICKFTASWCKPCKKIEPRYQLLAGEYHSSRTEGKNVSFVKVKIFVFIVN
jgi:thiol-disulfide isomerase/thioredoxin